MPEKMQQFFLLNYREGMTGSEFSIHLGMNVKAVKRQKYKALVASCSHFAQPKEPLLSVLVTYKLQNEVPYFMVMQK